MLFMEYRLRGMRPLVLLLLPAIDAAITKISSGDYDVAIVVGWELMKTVDAKICGDYLGHAAFYESGGKGN